ncbi:MAG TPA: Hsp20/alpha crystallin family protein [Pirellulaceae bacterium]
MVRHLIPWSSGGQLLDVVRREVDDLVGRLQDPNAWSDELASFAPRTNVAETDQHYEISLDLPGMKADDFQIEMHEGRLSISGERAKEDVENGKTYHRIERVYGKFRRSFTLGQDVDAESVSADYHDGVLRVTVPKTAKAQPKRISVKVS